MQHRNSAMLFVMDLWEREQRMSMLKAMVAIGGLLVLSWSVLIAVVWIAWTVMETLLGGR